MAKQKEDKFTQDAFAAPRRGRPRKLDAKTNAQRQREFRARKKAGSSDPVTQAVLQVRELSSMYRRLVQMSCDWAEVDECFRSSLERLADSVSDAQLELSEFIRSNGNFCDE